MSKFEKSKTMRFGNVTNSVLRPPPKLNSTAETILKAIETSENDKTLKEIVNESLNQKERLYNRNVIDEVIKNMESNIEMVKKPSVKFGSYNF